MRLLIHGGRLIDPAQSLDDRLDVLIADGRVVEVGPNLRRDGAAVLDAQGCVVCPGLIDLHTHLREPGQEHKETIATGTRAAAAGGFTTLCCMPNTEPALDDAAAIAFVQRRAAEVGCVRVLPIAAVTKGRAGRELVEMAELAAAGAVAFSDDGAGIQDAGVARRAFQYSRMLGRPIIEHCQVEALVGRGAVHEGPVAERLGLPPWPASGETVMLARDIALAEETGGWLHAAHLSLARSAELVREAKARGVRVTAEVCPHHLVMTAELVLGQWPTWPGSRAPHQPYDANTKVNPPLRTAADAAALLAALRDGTIDAIATDHAPHHVVDKACEYVNAAFGMSGLETALAALLILVGAERLDLPTLIARLTVGPARLLGRDLGHLRPEAVADVAVFDPAEEWQVTPERLYSLGKNTPFLGETVRGRVVATIVEGRVVHGQERVA